MVSLCGHLPAGTRNAEATVAAALGERPYVWSRSTVGTTSRRERGVGIYGSRESSRHTLPIIETHINRNQQQENKGGGGREN